MLAKLQLSSAFPDYRRWDTGRGRRNELSKIPWLRKSELEFEYGFWLHTGALSTVSRGGKSNVNGCLPPLRHPVRAAGQPPLAYITLCFSKLEPQLYLEVLPVQGDVCSLPLPPTGKNQPFSFGIR